jgi:hypothetical protein
MLLDSTNFMTAFVSCFPEILGKIYYILIGKLAKSRQGEISRWLWFGTGSRKLFHLKREDVTDRRAKSHRQPDKHRAFPEHREPG